MTTNTFPETNNYYMDIGSSENFGRDVYQVKNKDTQVVEFEHPQLPVARKVIYELQEFLDDILHEQDKPKEDTDGGMSNVTPIH